MIALALRHALACKGHSVRALGQTLSDFLGNTKVLDILLSSRGVDGRGHKKGARTYPYFCSELFSTPVASRHGKKVCERISAHAFVEFFS